MYTGGITTLLCLLLVAFITAELSEAPTKHTDSHHTYKSMGKDEQSGHIDKTKLYQQMLRKKRAEQSTAIKNLIHYKDVKQQNKMVKELLSRMLRIMSSAKTVLEKKKIEPELDRLPLDDDDLREHVTGLIENMPFFCEFALYYPAEIKAILSDRSLMDLIQWSYRYIQKLSIYDGKTMKMLHLAGQELLLIPREENFINPYDQLRMRDEMQFDAVQKLRAAQELKKKTLKDESKKGKRKNGPSMSRLEL